MENLGFRRSPVDEEKRSRNKVLQETIELKNNEEISKIEPGKTKTLPGTYK